MARTKIDDADLLETLTGLFRDRGYEGASLSEIAAATGLQRASLYHRFPGGKQEMALAVLQHVHRRFGERILAPAWETGSPGARAKRVARELDAFYEGGWRSCLIESLSLASAADEVRLALEASIDACIESFSRLAKDAGHSPAAARRRGRDALVGLQGSLVVARVTQDPQVFQRFLRELPEQLTGNAR